MEKKGNNLIFKVMLLGPRRTGKSSILASMISSFDEVAASTFLNVTPDSVTSDVTSNSLIKLRRIHDYYSHQRNQRFNMDENQNVDSNNFRYVITYRDKRNKTQTLAEAVIMDRPGEWISDPEHQEEMLQEIGEADVLLIAIDSVHLMEKNGAFCEVYHRISELNGFISKSTFLDEGSGKKLVMFIPLKCERYYHDHDMDKVNAAVHNHFSPIIQLVTGERVKDRVTVGIAPILTIGGIEFDSFGVDERGKIIRIKDWSQNEQLWRRPDPRYIYYRFYSQNPAFRPKYCEQPVLYLLYYIASLANNNSIKPLPTFTTPFMSGFIWVALLMIFNALKDKNVKMSLEMLKSKIKRSGQGYEIINNPLKI